MPTSYPLTGDFGDLLGGEAVVRGIRARLETNLPAGTALVDKTGKVVRLGGQQLSLDQAGKFSASVAATNATDLNVAADTLRYQVVADYTDPGTGRPAAWRSGWLAVTAATDIATAPTVVEPPAIVASGGIARTLLDAKGDLIAATGPDTAGRLPVGAAGRMLLADPAAATGLRWSSVGHFEGTGFPEGVVTADIGAEYVDRAATNGAVRWVKTTGNGTTGWRVTYGDTGTRNITATAVTNGWTAGALTVRRCAERIYVHVENLNGAASTSIEAFTLPAGFTPGGLTREIVGTTPQGDPTVTRLDANVNGIVNVVSVSGASYYFSLLLVTAGSWPTTLPGIPA